MHADQAALVKDQSSAYSLQVLGSCLCKNEMPRPRTAMSWIEASVLHQTVGSDNEGGLSLQSEEGCDMEN